MSTQAHSHEHDAPWAEGRGTTDDGTQKTKNVLCAAIAYGEALKNALCAAIAGEAQKYALRAAIACGEA